jgi:chromosome segregation protein
MRLSKIKLAGFKSFVDPTVLSFPSNLVSILGPNGCGKSNTIDAVRWVLGESSAKNLRGNSMTDVIFNGSSGRKPIGQASVELIFDNSDGMIVGEYAKYNEISVKRIVNREAQSQYYLNNVRCRRRDVTDLFLGTGLGPRSYSIIEQGMISRLIESRPEELRVYIEEAAGISKYKERRKETETRIRHTRENLERLDDIRGELEKQIAHLQRQARTAEKYTEYKKEERLTRAQLQALRWDDNDKQVKRQDAKITEKEILLEQHMADLRSVEAGLESSREEHIEANESFNQIQGEFYRIGAEIARVEQAITHAREKSLQYQKDLDQAEKAYENAHLHLQQDEQKMAYLAAQIEALEPEFEEAQEKEHQSAQLLAEHESSMQDWQFRWDEFNQNAQEPTQTAQVERARINQLEQNIINQQRRVEKLEDELSHFSFVHLEDSIGQLESETEAAEQLTEELQFQLDQERESIQSIRDENYEYNQQLDSFRSELQLSKGRKSSLEALQQAALGKTNQSLNQWMKKHQLSDKPLLAEKVSVKDGWDNAVECVLGNYLQATCVEQLDSFSRILGELGENSINLLETISSPFSDNHTQTPISLPLLVDYIEPLELIQPLVAGVFAAEDLPTALAHRKQLMIHQSIITREGIWLGPNWLRIVRESNHKGGILAREQELKALDEQLSLVEENVSRLAEEVDQGRIQLQDKEHHRENIQVEYNQQNRKLSELRSQLSTKQVRLEQMNSRKERIESDIKDIYEQLEIEKLSIEESTERLHTALEMMEDYSGQREALTQERENFQQLLEDIRIKAREDREHSHSLEIQLRGIKSEFNSLEQAISRLQEQLEELGSRREQLLELIHDDDDPLERFNLELETHLQNRLQVEEQLSAARTQVEELEQRLRNFDHKRAEIENELQSNRNQLEEVRIASQELIVRRQTLLEQVNESGFILEELLKDMPEEANERVWREQVAQIGLRIQRLGSINLAAIEEFKEQSERKQYLDSQNDDLISALDTLEGAIAKIDRETRTRFRETFDKINSGVQRLFPKLFGGGHAYLDLTGDDLLNTGVTIMARPPGKRNSTIHLLSGGEKAMTAVALVFAIFELNPAPFCMLDEVDAPLDEANVGRFCALVKEMSEKVQFIYITHNKITMEMSDHLCGVTMKEPGVSRIVDVDIHEAVEMVES